MGQFSAEADLHERIIFPTQGVLEAPPEKTWMSSTCRYMRGRTLIMRRPGSSLVLALPAAEIGRGELVTMAHSDFGHTGRITSTLLDFTADVVVAVGPGHKLSLIHI